MNVTRSDVTANGKKFLMNTLAPEAFAAITVVLNWKAGLKKERARLAFKPDQPCLCWFKILEVVGHACPRFGWRDHGV